MQKMWAAPTPPLEMDHVKDPSTLPADCLDWGQAYICLVRMVAAVVNAYDGGKTAPPVREVYYQLLQVLLNTDIAHYFKGFPAIASEDAFHRWLEHYQVGGTDVIAPCWVLWETRDRQCLIRMVKDELYWICETPATRDLDMWLQYSK
jgi:hypothetical protein